MYRTIATLRDRKMEVERTTDIRWKRNVEGRKKFFFDSCVQSFRTAWHLDKLFLLFTFVLSKRIGIDGINSTLQEIRLMNKVDIDG